MCSELESIMRSTYEDIRLNSSNEKNGNLLQGLGSVALKVLSSQRELVESYGNKDLENLLANIDNKIKVLSNALAQEINNKRGV